MPGVPGIDVRERQLEHPGADRSDHQRRTARPIRRRQQRQVIDGVVRAAPIRSALAEELADDHEGLLEAAHPMVVREAERPILRLVPAGAQAEDQPPAGDLVDGVRLGSEHGRVVEARRGHQRTQLDPRRDRRQRGERAPRLPWRDRLRPPVPIQQVVADPDRVETDRLRGPCHLGQLRPPDDPLHLGELDADLQRTGHAPGSGMSTRASHAASVPPASFIAPA
jgi:hypothetical protein